MTSNLELASHYAVEDVWFPCSESILEWDIDFHQLMLNDEIRMTTYRNAIQEAVKPGMVVLDIGTGTGILGLWALQAGAKHLYAIDVNPKILSVAVQNFEQAGFSGQYEVFNDLSNNIDLPIKVDLIISEIMGNLADNEDFIPILTDAHQRFLAAGGKMLPAKVCSKLTPISSLRAHQQVQSKSVHRINPSYSIDGLLQRLAIESPFNIYYDVIIPDKCCLSTAQTAREFKLDGNDQSVYEIDLNFQVDTDGVFTGFKGSFVADLSDSVTLDTSGCDIVSKRASNSWKHCYLPIEDPFDVKCGDEIQLLLSRFYPSCESLPFRQCYQWSGIIKRQSQVVKVFSQSMENKTC